MSKKDKKDDYLQIRCSKKFKGEIANKANSLRISVSEYLEFLIRKDLDDMIFFYDLNNNETLTPEMMNVIINSGMGIKVSENSFFAKTNRICVMNTVVESDCDLATYIRFGCEDDETDDIIPKNDAINVLIDRLYEEYSEEYTYADEIYSNSDPDKKIDELINEIAVEILREKLDSFNTKCERKIEQALNGQLWEH